MNIKYISQCANHYWYLFFSRPKSLENSDIKIEKERKDIVNPIVSAKNPLADKGVNEWYNESGENINKNYDESGKNFDKYF